MSALANIKATSILNATGGAIAFTNSATVGYNKTFVPDGPIAPGVQQYSERSGSYPIAFPKYTISVTRPKAGSRVFRIKEKVVVPTLNVTSPTTGSGIQPLPSVGYNCIMTREFVIPEAATAAEKLLFWSYVQSMNAYSIAASDSSPVDDTGAPITAAVLDGEVPY